MKKRWEKQQNISKSLRKTADLALSVPSSLSFCFLLLKKGDSDSQVLVKLLKQGALPRTVSGQLCQVLAMPMFLQKAKEALTAKVCQTHTCQQRGGGLLMTCCYLKNCSPRPSHQCPFGHLRAGFDFYFARAWTLKFRSRPPFTSLPKGPGRKVPHGVLFECIWAPDSECPKSAF